MPSVRAFCVHQCSIPREVVCSQASFVEPVPIPRSLSVTWMPGSQVVGWRMHHRHWLASSGALTAFLPSTLDMFAEFILYVAGSTASTLDVFVSLALSRDWNGCILPSYRSHWLVLGRCCTRWTYSTYTWDMWRLKLMMARESDEHSVCEPDWTEHLVRHGLRETRLVELLFRQSYEPTRIEVLNRALTSYPFGCT